MGTRIYPPKQNDRRNHRNIYVPPKPLPHWVCHECGADKCKREPWGGTTWHYGRCDLCHNNALVTELRDFGGLK